MLQPEAKDTGYTHVTNMHQVSEDDIHMLATSGCVIQHLQSAFNILPFRLQTIHGTACKSLQLCSVLMDLPCQLCVLTHPCRQHLLVINHNLTLSGS